MINDRNHSTLLSLQKLAILAECVSMEICNELLGQNFNVPTLNNFARRIKSDSGELISRLEKSGRYGVRMTELTEAYSSEIWRTVTLLNGLPLDAVKEFNDNLEAEFKEIGV